MTPLAENRTTVDRALFREGMLRISGASYRKAAWKGVGIFLGLWLALLVYTLLSGGSLAQTMSYLILIGVMGLWIGAYLPRYSADRAWKTWEGKYGDRTERTVSFYGDFLTISGEGVQKEVPYEEIRKVQESNNLLILLCEDRTGILLDKKAFRGNNKDEIKALILGAEE